MTFDLNGAGALKDRPALYALNTTLLAQLRQPTRKVACYLFLPVANFCDINSRLTILETYLPRMFDLGNPCRQMQKSF